MKKIVLVLSVLLLFAGCDFDSNRLERIKVSGEVISIEDTFTEFNQIMVAGPFDIMLDPNMSHGIELESYESLIDLFRAEVHNDILMVYILDTTRADSFNYGESDISECAIMTGARLKWPENKKNLNLKVSYEMLEKITAIGECSIKSKQVLEGDELDLEVAGALDFEAELLMNTFNAEIAGAGNLKLKGTVDTFNLDCAGAGTIKAYELIADHVDLEIAGVCNAKVHALERLDAEVAGVGTIKYKGSPSIINYDKAGLGSLKPAEDEEDNTEI